MKCPSQTLSVVALALGIAACGSRAPAPDDVTGSAPEPPSSSEPPAEREPQRDPALPPLGVPAVPAPPAPEHVRWIVAGGGATPIDNQVSIEDDLALAAETLAGDGVLLFAGGAGTHGVQVLDAEPRGDRLTSLLGDLFDPRGGRNTHYRPTRLEPNGPATAARFADALAGALARPSDGPLTVYLAGHGVPAARRADVQLAMWGGRGLLPADLAALLDKNPAAGRQVRFILTSCFSGAFADALFVAGDPDKSAAAPLRCGFFAAPWDRPSSGCDPDPDGRRSGYGVQLLRALAGVDPAGEPTELALLDLDHDGHVSLLEAHTRARVIAPGFDVPTTTSERWLRVVAAEQGWPVPLAGDDPAPSAPPDLPEEDAVIAALSRRLAVADEAAVAAHVAEQRAGLAELDAEVLRASEAEAVAGDRIAAATLARWPVLDDPWHPDYAATLATERAAIEDWFQVHADYHGYLAAREATGRAADRRDTVVLTLSPWLTLQRAFETRRLAGHLQHLGGEALATFEALRACERGRAR